MRAMHTGSVLEHLLMDGAAQQGVPAKFVRGAEADLVDQKVLALGGAAVLGVGAVAVGLVAVAHGGGKQVGRVGLGLGRGAVDACCDGAQQRVEDEREPAEDSVVLRDLALFVPGHPRVDEHGQLDAKGG